MDVGSAVYAGAINCRPCRLRYGIHASEDLLNTGLEHRCLLDIGGAVRLIGAVLVVCAINIP